MAAGADGGRRRAIDLVRRRLEGPPALQAGQHHRTIGTVQEEVAAAPGTSLAQHHGNTSELGYEAFASAIWDRASGRSTRIRVRPRAMMPSVSNWLSTRVAVSREVPATSAISDCLIGKAS